MSSVSREVDEQHKSLLIKLCDMMDPNDPTYKNFILYLSASIPEGRLSRVEQNPTDVFALMEKIGFLKAGKYQDLEKALEASGYINILDLLKKEGECITRRMRKRSYSDGPMADDAPTVSFIQPEDSPKNIINNFNIGTVINSNIVPSDSSHIIINVSPQKDGVKLPSDIQDIKKLFITAYEGIQIISISPVLTTPINMMNLEDFYTDIVIEEEIKKSAQMRNDKQHVVKVTSFRQIFEKHDKKVRRIILKAPAGQGKSTFCRKLVHSWCSVHNKKLKPQTDDTISNKSETDGLKDEDEMLRFDVLLYICLRDISHEKTLMDVIYTQFPLHESHELSHRSHIEELIGQAENNSVLLIMDGLDEMDNSSSFIKKIMQKSLYPHLTVLATTRPWKIDQLGLIRSAHIDLLLDLKGFSYENSMLFAKKIFNKYYNDESATEQFKQDIGKNSMIAGLIKVPLLLLFIIHVWYERKSFPETINELYIDILDVMVNRYMEGKNTEQKSNGEEDEKKNIGQKTWPLEGTTFIVTPKLRDLSLVRHFGEGFLAALCDVANHFLIIDAKETSLVFEEKSLINILGNDGKLDTAQKVGLLSNSDSPGIREKKKCLTFLHKTVQEFLAAINICCREGRYNIFLDSLNTLDDVFQNENIIRFVAGISTSKCQEIFEKIYEICDKDMDQACDKDMDQACNKDVDQADDEDMDQGHDNDMDQACDKGVDQVVVDRRNNHMLNLCRLHRDCIREANRQPIHLKLHTLYAVFKDSWNVLQSALKKPSDIRTHLKRLYLSHCNLDDVLLDLTEYSGLTELWLYFVTMKGKLLLSKNTHFKYLNLSWSDINDVTLDLSEANSLEYLILVAVTTKGKLFLSKCTQLKCLKLVDCSLDIIRMDLSESNSLEYLRLINVTMKGELLLSKCTQLKCLKLVHCSLHDITFNLPKTNSLKFLSLIDVTLKGKVLLSKCTQVNCLKLVHGSLDDATMDLSEFNCLTNLYLGGVEMKGMLLPTKLTQLKSLELARCNFKDATLDLSESTCLKRFLCCKVTMTGRSRVLLSKCTQLEDLKVNKCHLGELVLDWSWSACLNKLILRDVTVTSTSQLKHSHCTKIEHPEVDTAIQLADSAQNQVKLEELYIDIKILDDTVDLSDSTQSKCLRLNMKIFDDSQMLCRILSQNEQLTRLSLINLDLGDALLSLDNLQRLYNLTIDNVTMYTDQYMMLCNSISMCTNLVDLSLTNLDLIYVQLHLDSIQKLRKLTIHNVAMCKDGYMSISMCTNLTDLSLMNLDLGDAQLSLNNIKELCDLYINNVTMSKDGYMMLLNSMSMCTELSSISLINLALGDALLSFDFPQDLEYLTIDNVTMCKNGYVMLCYNMSKCTILACLSLKNLDLGDAQLSLENLKNLYDLTINKVTMCKDGYVVLCNSISTCTELTHLSLTNLDLDDALLSLNCIQELEHLTINDVTMCKDGYMMLCNSISKCTKLTHLSLTNLDLGDTIPHMENLKELELVNITISSQYVDCIKSSLQHLSSLCFFKSNTENLIIEKAVDNHEKYVVKHASQRHFIDNEFLYNEYDDDTNYPDDYEYYKKYTLREKSNMYMYFNHPEYDINK